MTLNIQDCHGILRLGARYAKDRRSNDVISAAMYYEIAKDSEKMTVRLEFEEGVRNNVPNQSVMDEIMKTFEDWVRFWKLRSEEEINS